MPVHRRSGVDQRPGDRAGAGQLSRQPEPVVVEPQHGHVADRASGLVVGPVLHLGSGQLRMLGQQPGQPGQVAAVEDVAAFHLKVEPGPAGEPVLPGQRQLRRGQHERARDRVDPRDRIGVAALSGAQKILGLALELAQVRPGRQVSHDVSLITRWSATGPEENVTLDGCYLRTEVDSVLPATQRHPPPPDAHRSRPRRSQPTSG